MEDVETLEDLRKRVAEKVKAIEEEDFMPDIVELIALVTKIAIKAERKKK